jgi:SH3 domain protein
LKSGSSRSKAIAKLIDTKGTDNMKRLSLLLVLAVCLTSACFPAAGWGAKAYVADPKETALRAGPGTNYKVLATIPTGTGLEVVKAAEWIQVRLAGPGAEVKDGWVLNTAVAPFPPESTFVKELQTENAQINEKLNSLEREKADLLQKDKELAEKLKKVETAFESLKSGSTNYLKLKEESDAAKAALTSAEENVQALIQENEDLKFSARIKWFIAGAMVLLFGWVLGWLTSRSRKRHRSYTL